MIILVSVCINKEIVLANDQINEVVNIPDDNLRAGINEILD